MEDLRVNENNSENENNSKKKSIFSKFIVEEIEDDKNIDESADKKKSVKERQQKSVANRKKRAKRPLTKADIQKRKRLRAQSTYTLRLSIKCVAYALLVVFIYLACMKAYSFGSEIFNEKGMEEEGREVVITIPAGATEGEVADILKENGLIKDEFIFKIQTFLYDGQFYSGTFVLNTSDGPEEIIETLSTKNGEKETQEE